MLSLPKKLTAPLVLLACLLACSCASAPNQDLTSLNEENARTLVNRFLSALERGDTETALALTPGSWDLVHDGQHQHLSKTELASLLDRAGKALADKFNDRPHLYWDSADPRALVTAYRWPSLASCGWIGVVFENRSAVPLDAKKPFAVKLVDDRLSVVGFHDD